MILELDWQVWDERKLTSALYLCGWRFDVLMTSNHHHLARWEISIRGTYPRGYDTVNRYTIAMCGTNEAKAWVEDWIVLFLTAET